MNQNQEMQKLILNRFRFLGQGGGLIMPPCG